MRLAALLLACFVTLGHAAGGGKGKASHGSAPAASGGTMASSGSRGGGGGGMRSALGRQAPPLAEGRKIHEQDCTKPIDWQAGNLRCK